MPISRSEWTKRFATHLLTLQAMRLPTSMDIANAQYEADSEMPPEEAADIFALEEPPGDVGWSQ
jgi:hypothetical protein